MTEYYSVTRYRKIHFFYPFNSSSIRGLSKLSLLFKANRRDLLIVRINFEMQNRLALAKSVVLLFTKTSGCVILYI